MIEHYKQCTKIDLIESDDKIFKAKQKLNFFKNYLSNYVPGAEILSDFIKFEEIEELESQQHEPDMQSRTFRMRQQ